MSAKIVGGMNLLIKWGLFECNEEFGDELKAAGFDGSLVRNIVHAALVISPLFEAHQHHIVEGWKRNPDLTLRIMTTTRQRVPLPCSTLKQMRIWAFLLKPVRVVTVVSAERVAWAPMDGKSAKGDKSAKMGPCIGKTHDGREIRRFKYRAADCETAEAASKYLDESVTPAEIATNRNRLKAEIGKRKLLSQDRRNNKTRSIVIRASWRFPGVE